MSATPTGREPKAGKLNDKQLRFAEEYLKDFNAAQAAIRAGYSAKTAKQIGHRLLTNVDLQAVIQATKLQDSARIGIDRLRILEDMNLAATLDYRKFFKKNEKGETVPLDILEWPDEVARVATVEFTPRGMVVRVPNRQDAAEGVLKLGMGEGPKEGSVDALADAMDAKMKARLEARLDAEAS